VTVYWCQMGGTLATCGTLVKSGTLIMGATGRIDSLLIWVPLITT